MAFLEIKNVRIAGIASGVPKHISSNLELEAPSDVKYTREEFIKGTGVLQKRCSKTLTTSDLCYEAAERLIADLGWKKDEIDALILVTQTPDYIYPATACILQYRLGLSKECFAQDISLGCSGWVYGLSNAASLISGGMMRKALLLAGDAKGIVYEEDALFGHAGTVTALEHVEGADGFKFHFGTDGSGYDTLIVPDGGCRNGINDKSFEVQEMDGTKYTRIQGYMKGMDVFGFGISTVPKSVRQLSERFSFDYKDCDYLVLHQANMLMNNMIVKTLRLPTEKALSCMADFGNTSSASIPLTITTQLRESACGKKFICCGFGVGLSWGTVAFKTDNIVISDLAEVEEKEYSTWV